MNLKIYDDSKNYTCQVVKLPNKIPVKGLDNLVEVNIQGNSCLIGKDSDSNELYLFFPAESQISHEFLSNNNLYRNSELNKDKTQKGFFEDNRRVKAVKFKGIISTGFVIPISSLPDNLHVAKGIGTLLSVGDEFNSIDDIEICRKYIKPRNQQSLHGTKKDKTRVLDNIIDSKMAPEHFDTSHLMKNIHKLSLDDYVAITYKLHGTSSRYYNTLVKRKLSLLERVSKFFGCKVQEEEYNDVAASRRVIKSIGYKPLSNKNHYYDSGDLWTEVGEQFFKGKLNKGESIYCEIIGRTYSGEEIQKGYTYGFEIPKVYIYRITNINSQGVEVDLSYHQMKDRAKQLGIETCPELFYGRMCDFINNHLNREDYFDNDMEWWMNNIFYNQLLEKPSILDKSVVEEGFCLRIDKYPKPDIYKIKAKSFLLHEGVQLDKQVENIEE